MCPFPILLVVLASGSSLTSAAPVWRDLGGGLELAELPSPRASSLGDSRITVLRIDPARAKFRLLTATQLHQAPATAREWATRYKLRAVINAGMFEPDLRPSAFLKSAGVIVNGRVGKQGSVFAFGAQGARLPPAQLIDRSCEDYPTLGPRYDSQLQSLRVIDCHGKIVWSRQPKVWSMALLGMDHAGRILFLHCRSPYAVHDLAEILQQLPLDLDRLMYLEGGPEATLFVKAGGAEVEKVGSYETGFLENDSNDHAWDLPNVLGIESTE